MRLEIGSADDTYMGRVSSKAFSIALQGLRRPFFVEKLTIHFHIHSCGLVGDLEEFLRGLTRVRVSRVLTVTGPSDLEYEEAVHDIADTCHMDVRPVWTFHIPARARSSACGFSYWRFRPNSDLFDDDDLDGVFIQGLVTAGAHARGFDDIQV